MNDTEFDHGSDQEISENHSKLIEEVSKLDKGQRVKKPLRSEPSLEVSEFHLVKSGIADKDAVLIDDLAKSLRGKGHRAEISQKLRTARQKSQVLSKPLEKPAADRLKRIVGFDNTKKELGAWNAVVMKNRTAESLTFPLNRSSIKMQPSQRFIERFRLRSDLEKELAALEPAKPAPVDKVDEFPMTLEEIIGKRKEAARFRARQSYGEAKARRLNKIKSKKFHRIQKKALIKRRIKDFEELQKTDPSAALEKLEELEKSRAEERMSLRHKNTGQWAKSKQIRAKYDKESRQVLARQLSISKALTQKIRNNEDSGEDSNDEDKEITNQVSGPSVNDRDNPWINGVKTSTEIDDFISGYRKYWDENNKALKEKNSTNRADVAVDDTGKKNNGKNVIVKMAKIRSNNPVESVTEEYDETKENSPSGRLKTNRRTENKKKKRKISTTNEARKIENYETMEREKIPKKKTKLSSENGKWKKFTKPKKAGTSKWHVESVSDECQMEKTTNEKSLEIDDIFETMEDRMISRIDTKLKSVKKKLATNAAAYKKCKISNDKFNECTDDDLSFKKRNIRPDIDEEMNENTGISGNQAIRLSNLNDVAIIANGVDSRIQEKQNDDIDPNKFINVKPKHLKTQLPDTITGGDEGLDDSENDNDQHNIISEAFEDDDVVDEFRKEKAEEIKKSQPEDIDLRLPGWGSWGGKNIVQSTRKKRRFVLKFPKEVKRRDENKGDVIIIEEKDPKIREHQVSDLPYPFNSVKDFEASIRAPIGRNFVPENAHKRFIRPAVKTKMGKIIEPMDAEVLISKNTKTGKPTRGVRREKRNVEKIKL